MGRLNIAKELVETFVQITGVRLQAWMAPAFFLLVGLLLFPMIRRTHRVGKARKRLRLIPYRRLAERQRLVDEAMSLVHGNPAGQLALAEEAMRLGRRPVVERALAELEGSGRYQRQRRALQQQLEKPGAHSALEARAAIEHLVEAGLYDEARRRLELSRQRWPSVREWPVIPTGGPDSTTEEGA
jgi:hypothetical protein